MNAVCSEGLATVFEGCFGFNFIAELALTILFWVSIFALFATLLLAAGLVRRYRTRVQQSMRAAKGAPSGSRQATESPSIHAQGTLSTDVFRVTEERIKVASSTSLLNQLRRQARQLAFTYAGAVSIQPLALAIVLIVAIRFVPTDNVILKYALIFLVFLLPNATPLILVPPTILTRRFVPRILAVLALILTLFAIDRAVGTDQTGLWWMVASVPTSAILLLNTRRLRAAGPILFAAVLIFSYCAAAGVSYATAIAWNVMGPVRFVREDLAPLPLLEGAQRYAHEIWSLPVSERLAEIKAFVDRPTSVLNAAHPEAVTSTIKAEVFGVSFAAMILGATGGFAFVRWLAVHYRTRRASDQMLSVDVLMAIFSLSSLVTLWAAFGWPAGIAAIVTFGFYVWAARAGLRRRRRAARLVEPRTLLFLRVFGFDRRTQRLLEDLEQRWRYLGPIRLIGGADLAYSTLEPHEFFEFLSGRLARTFVKDRQDLEKHLADDYSSPDPDGLFRVDDVYCFEDTWKMTVSRLAGEADAVLMDLRGFSPSNRGVIFEIGQLLASVPVARIVLLVDRATDQSFLERTLHDAWNLMPSDSPNCVEGDHRLRMMFVSSSRRRTLDTLIGLLAESVPLGAPLAAESGR